MSKEEIAVCEQQEAVWPSSTAEDSLFLAIQIGVQKRVAACLPHIPDINCVHNTRRNGYGFLEFACHIGNKKIVDLLLLSGADQNLRRDGVDHCLCIASRLGFVEVVKSLLANGAPVDILSTAGYTPLHLAIIHRRVEVVRVLVSNGANIERRNPEGYSALMVASRFASDTEIVEYLISMGSLLEAVCPQGMTALQLAAQSARPCAVIYLVNIGANYFHNYHERDSIIHSFETRSVLQLWYQPERVWLRRKAFLVFLQAHHFTSSLQDYYGGRAEGEECFNTSGTDDSSNTPVTQRVTRSLTKGAMNQFSPVSIAGLSPCTSQKEFRRQPVTDVFSSEDMMLIVAKYV